MENVCSRFSDEELTELICRENDELAFAALYERHVRSLIHIAIRKTGNKSTAEDLVQEVFFKFWLARHKMDIEKNPYAYLQGMLKNNIITHYYREQKKQMLTLEEVPAPSDDHTQEHLEFQHLSEYYEQSLLKLPEKCRAVFILSRKGYSLKEIARTLEISEKTTEAHISKALRILRIELKDYMAITLLGVQLYELLLKK